MVQHTISLIVSSYNHPNTLGRVLVGFAVQDDLDFEMIIADDGSDPDTRELVEEFAMTAPFSVKFITQEHGVFGKARILNKAVAISRGDQLIFCDGDCIPFHNCISLHRALYRPNSFLCGGYVYLTLEQSQAIDSEAVRKGAHEKLLGFKDLMYFNKIHFKNILYRVMRVRDKPKMLGGNFSVDRESYVAVNGYDETFEGMSGVDSDIRNHLKNSGVTGISVWNRIFVCHLHHGLDPRRCSASVKRAKRNPEILYPSRKRLRALKGLSQYDPAVVSRDLCSLNEPTGS